MRAAKYNLKETNKYNYIIKIDLKCSNKTKPNPNTN